VAIRSAECYISGTSAPNNPKDQMPFSVFEFIALHFYVGFDPVQKGRLT